MGELRHLPDVETKPMDSLSALRAAGWLWARSVINSHCRGVKGLWLSKGWGGTTVQSGAQPRSPRRARGHPTAQFHSCLYQVRRPPLCSVFNLPWRENCPAICQMMAVLTEPAVIKYLLQIFVWQHIQMKLTSLKLAAWGSSGWLMPSACNKENHLVQLNLSTS